MEDKDELFGKLRSSMRSLFRNMELKMLLVDEGSQEFRALSKEDKQRTRDSRRELQLVLSPSNWKSLVEKAPRHDNEYLVHYLVQNMVITGFAERADKAKEFAEWMFKHGSHSCKAMVGGLFGLPSQLDIGMQ